MVKKSFDLFDSGHERLTEGCHGTDLGSMYSGVLGTDGQVANQVLDPHFSCCEHYR